MLSEKALSEPRLHPRCGTSFLVIVVLCTWLIFLFVTPQGILARIASRIALLPVVAGVSYEVLKMSAKERGCFEDHQSPRYGASVIDHQEPGKEQLDVAACSLALLQAEEEVEQ